VIAPLVGDAGKSFLSALDDINVDDLCNRALAGKVFADVDAKADFTI
jgi:hypothetical protein